jgi:hypothetical protein
MNVETRKRLESIGVNAILGTIAGAMFLGILFVIMLLMRYFSSVTVSIVVEDVEPGVRCARVVTGDGAAIDCWKVDP